MATSVRLAVYNPVYINGSLHNNVINFEFMFQLQELQDRKKIHHLLQLSGLTEREVSYFMKEPPAKPVVEQILPEKLKHLHKQRPTGL